MKTTIGKRFRYWLENFMAHGGVAVFLSLLILFIIALIVLTIIRGIFVALNPDEQITANFFKHFWRVFLGLTDPGTLGMEGGDFIWYYIVGTVTILSGLVIFSMLIAFITTHVEEIIYNFRKGKSQVIEQGHTLILGWNERIFDVMKELIVANESERNGIIVILSEEDKETMDHKIAKQFSRMKTMKIITRTGDTSSLNELKRVNAKEAKSAIILSCCPDSSSDDMKEISDTKTIKTILALLMSREEYLINYNRASTNVEEKAHMTIVAEIFSNEKRKILDSLRFRNVISIDSREILGKLLVQTSLSSGLELVYSEILSFKGCEIYKYRTEWGNIPFGELQCHFIDGIPLGIMNKDNILALRPPATRKMEKDDSIFILAEDDSTIKFKKQKIAEPKQYSLVKKETSRKVEKELLLGWHSIAEIILREFANFLPGGSAIDIMIYKPSAQVEAKIKSFQEEFRELKISLIHENPLSPRNLKNISPFSYNNIIILAQDEKDYTPEKVDSDTMLILLLLRELINEQGISEKKTKIITQILNSDNQELIEQSNVDDFIISNKMITKIIAQISENHEIKFLYDQLFCEEGSEIYIKPVPFYFDTLPVNVSFLDILSQVQQRQEICLGIRRGALLKDPLQNFGVLLNPEKNRVFTLTADDSLVVLAEDEL
ncbi:MAG: hypothetical protein JXB88_20920 [Spirochaetales bacterium]|nr:hypothetical protein [Spirochaetales bacterium]